MLQLDQPSTLAAWESGLFPLTQESRPLGGPPSDSRVQAPSLHYTAVWGNWSFVFLIHLMVSLSSPNLLATQ